MAVLQEVGLTANPSRPTSPLASRHTTQRSHRAGLGSPAFHATGKFHKHNVAIGQHFKLDRIAAAAHQHLTLKPAGIVRSAAADNAGSKAIRKGQFVS